jgi:hypothetical protein
LHTRLQNLRLSFGLLFALDRSLWGGRMVRREHLYAISICDRPATVSQRLGRFPRIVKCQSDVPVSGCE